MQIYILRHGIAEEGKEKLQSTLACVRKAGVRPDLIVSSPYKRALETAALAQEELDVKPAIVKTDALTPMEKPEKVWDEIRLHRDAGQIVLAGHEPQLSSLVSYLIGSPGANVEMKKGAIARVDVESLGPRPNGVLVWLLTAKLAGC